MDAHSRSVASVVSSEAVSDVSDDGESGLMRVFQAQRVQVPYRKLWCELSGIHTSHDRML